MSNNADEENDRFVSDSPEPMSEAEEDGVASDGQDSDADVEQDLNALNGHSNGEVVYRVVEEGSDGSQVEDEDSEDEGEDDDEDDDEEPTLKYDRLGGSVHDLLHKDSASALAYSNKKLVCLLTSVSMLDIVPMTDRFLGPMQASYIY